MFKAAVIGLLGVATMSFEIEQVSVPHTNIGDATVACNPGSAPKKTNGFTTWFKDDTYACEKWNHKAKSMSDCFVAINGVCGMKTGTFCDHCVLITNSNGESEKCRVIDFCDPSNCDFLDPGHLDILNNAGNAHYKFTDKGKNVVPYKGAGELPAITWAWTSC
jgi:uncharacterized Zn-binding protein involved in type VI secretion